MKINNTVLVFDLDDTLCPEINYLRSAYQSIAERLAEECNIPDLYAFMWKHYTMRDNVFELLESITNGFYSTVSLLKLYREHKPNIYLNTDVVELLNFFEKQSLTMGLITDGRSITQRNKIESLKLYEYIPEDNIIISEEFGSCKPCLENYTYFMHKYPEMDYIYIGDNPKKDFIAPNKLNWTTVCLLDNGENNIHKQEFHLEKEFLPKIKINNLKELINLFDKV